MILTAPNWFLKLIEPKFPNLVKYWPKFEISISATMEMFYRAGIISFIIGLFIGIILTITKSNGIKPIKPLYSLLSVIINLLRAIPFIILLIFLIPYTRKIVGTAIGVDGAIIPLVFGTVPFYARQVETALANVDDGKIEAARSMGCGTIGLIFRVYLKESVPELIRVTTITAISLVGLTAMAGAVGAGGLGDFAKVYGQGLFQWDIVYGCIIILVIIVCIIQAIGTIFANRTTNRKLLTIKIKIENTKEENE